MFDRYMTVGSIACMFAIFAGFQGQWDVAVIFAAVGAYCLWRKMQITPDQQQDVLNEMEPLPYTEDEAADRKSLKEIGEVTEVPRDIIGKP
jgi:hypothetical protein